VPPADNDIATACRMAVVAEIPALKFKLDLHALPSFRTDLALCLTVREPSLHSFDHVAQLLGEHPKQEYHALLVDQFMPQPAEVQGVAIDSAIFYRHVPCFLRWNSGSQVVVRSALLL